MADVGRQILTLKLTIMKIKKSDFKKSLKHLFFQGILEGRKMYSSPEQRFEKLYKKVKNNINN